MDDLTAEPMGMISHQEILNLLVGLYETGGCDYRTLRIVALSVGVRESFDREVGRMDGTVAAVDKPVFLLSS